MPCLLACLRGQGCIEVQVSLCYGHAGLDEVPTSAQVQHIDREHSHIITDFLDRLHSLHDAWGSTLPEGLQESHPSFPEALTPVSHRTLS